MAKLDSLFNEIIAQYSIAYCNEEGFKRLNQTELAEKLKTKKDCGRVNQSMVSKTINDEYGIHPATKKAIQMAMEEYLSDLKAITDRLKQAPATEEEVEYKSAFWAAQENAIWHNAKFFFQAETQDSGKLRVENLFRNSNDICTGKFRRATTGQMEIEIAQPNGHSAYIIAFVNSLSNAPNWNDFFGQYLSVSHARNNPITVRPIVFYQNDLLKEKVETWLENQRNNPNWWKMHRHSFD